MAAIWPEVRAELARTTHQGEEKEQGGRALLVHFAAPSPAAAAEAQPLLDLLRCFAAAQGIAFELDTAPRVRFSWVGNRRVGLVFLDSYVLMEEASSLPSGLGGGLLQVARALDRDAEVGDGRLLEELAPDETWQHVERSLDIVEGNPVRWSKVWSIDAALRKHRAVVYLDYDVTVRPDCLHTEHFLDALFSPTAAGGPSPILAVRDSPVGVDCLNSGFLALRQAPATLRFMELWKSKLHWPGILHADQGALAETILELLAFEHASASAGGETVVSGYDHSCLKHLFLTKRATRPWLLYCDCFQQVLDSLVGPYGSRRSGLVRFVNPRQIDVNFVPNSLTPAHGQDLRNMRLLPLRRVTRMGAVTPRLLSPLIVHWAGTENRTRLMRGYLVRRFGISPRWFHATRTTGERCRALALMRPMAGGVCIPGELGTGIEHVFDSWEAEARTDSIFRAEQHEGDEAAAWATLEAIIAAPVGTPIPDVSLDPVTASAELRGDLVGHLGGPAAVSKMAAMEIGGYLGYTARFLAEHFREVLTVEELPHFASLARLVLAKFANAKVLQLSTLRDDWTPMVSLASQVGGLDVVLIDGDHDYQAVLNDIELAIFARLGPASREGRPRFVAFDDYFLLAGVAQAVTDAIELGLLRPVAMLGRHDGLLCEVTH